MFHVKQRGPTDGSVLRLREDAAAVGASIDDRQARAMLHHLDLVLRKNIEFNLTAITDFESALSRHIVDSLTAVRMVSAAPPGRMADLGSGAGFPGIPIAIACARSVTLVESVKKKAAFLENVLRELELDGDVAARRSEELSLEQPGAFGCVVTRAVASLPCLVELAAPLLAPGGVLVALKGADIEDEAVRGDSAAKLCGLARTSSQRVVVPGLHEARTLVAYSRIGEPGVTLPRRAGVAAKRPLG